MVQIVPDVLATLNAIDPELFEAEYPNVDVELHLEDWTVEVHMLLLKGKLPALKHVRKFVRQFDRPCTVERFVQRGEDPLQTITIKFPYGDT